MASAMTTTSAKTASSTNQRDPDQRLGSSPDVSGQPLDGVGGSSRLIACGCPKISLPLHAAVPSVLHDASRRPGGRRDALAPPVGAGGYVRQLGAGIYSLLPLGKRVNDRVEQVIREEQGGSALRNWRCQSSIQRTSGRPAAAIKRSARSSAASRTATARHGPRDDARGSRGLLLADIVKSYRRQLPMQVTTSRPNGATSLAPAAAHGRIS